MWQNIGKFGCSASFASSGRMRHALRVQNIISVTTVTMSRLIPFVMTLLTHIVLFQTFPLSSENMPWFLKASV